MSVTSNGIESGVWDDATQMFTPWPGGVEGEPRPYNEAEIAEAAARAATIVKAGARVALIGQVAAGVAALDAAQAAFQQATNKTTALTVAEHRALNNQHLILARILEKVVRVLADLVDEV